ncbi:S8 family peptidase [Deinococcus pimensis]|uniref:S8 family peptidase n=1 Tax=Deinococcus pimensis TaxID=309888 RepID=UPI000488E3B5|nr:S8 family peptidase [Deinococcus pimensis]
MPTKPFPAVLTLLPLLLAACGTSPVTLPDGNLAGTPKMPTASLVAGKTLAPVVTTGDDVIEGRYIVTLHHGSVRSPAGGLSAMSERDLVGALGLDANGTDIRHVYDSALQGFAATLSPRDLLKLRADPRVLAVEPDRIVRASATQTGATWGLDRIDQRALPLSGTYGYTPSGTGVNVYVVDTGINTAHTDFGGRADIAFDALGGDGQDCNGHGTHVAGTVGSATWGVAKNVRLHAVRVLDCSGSGSNSAVIAGIDWVARNARRPAVANLSLGGVTSASLDSAVQNAINSGVTFTVAAGNENKDACTTSPARLPAAITVGATTSTDARASFSNYGSCVDLFAPGQSIRSTWIGSATATGTSSGTSMAAPHVAGVAALYLEGHPAAAPAEVANAILGAATPDRVAGPAGSPNLLLFSGLTGATTPAPAPAPTPAPAPAAPCTSCEKYAGTLSGGGAYAYLPNGNYFQTSGGTLRGWLRGPSGTDFDLYLFRWNGGGWTQVAASESTTSEESVTYGATSGYYLWEVLSYSGSGAYDFWLQRP